MPQPNLIRFQCTNCKRYNYWSKKNLKTSEGKLALKKFCKWCRKHTPHTEAKKT